MVGAYDRALSLTTMTRGRLDAAMVFSASHAIPPVSAPSPTTATTARRSSSPVSARAFARPSARLPHHTHPSCRPTSFHSPRCIRCILCSSDARCTPARRNLHAAAAPAAHKSIRKSRCHSTTLRHLPAAAAAREEQTRPQGPRGPQAKGSLGPKSLCSVFAKPNVVGLRVSDRHPHPYSLRHSRRC